MPTTKLFISYARIDDEPFVKRLYDDLKDEFDIWWDRVSMPNRGLTFLQEIREAIDAADRVVLIAGPAAWDSDYVRHEWQYAYQIGKPINIALRLGDYPDLPSELRSFDAPDFRDDADYAERLATLRRQLLEPIAQQGRFHGVPALPPRYLNRPDDLDAVRKLVITDVDTPTLISAEKRTTAVEGMGGIGKSVLATAFAHDRQVRFAFPNGIIWVTAGQKPNLIPLYRAVGVALGDDHTRYPDEITAKQNAQHMLQDKQCLIIVDDIWELGVARAFRDLISGTRARLLITTRNLQINDMLNAQEYRLQLLGKDQSVDYLRQWVGDDPHLETVAEKLGHLFLALKLAGARMKSKNLSGQQYLEKFKQVSRMKVRGSDNRDDNLQISIEMSVQAAFSEVENEPLLYYTFGIFQEDQIIPQETILQFWGHLRPDIDEFEHEETLDALVELALVERDTEDGTVTLHDLLHSYTREQLGDLATTMHNALLASYAVDAWHELSPHEPYLWHNLAYHLIESEQRETLRSLVLNLRFMTAKLIATDPGALSSDAGRIEAVDPVMQIMRSFWQLSAHIMSDPHNSDQLHNQIIGRLGLHEVGQSEIAELLVTVRRAAEDDERPLLILQQPTFDPAGGMLERILAGHTDPVNGALEMNDNRILSWSWDRTLRLWGMDGEPLIIFEGHTGGVDGALPLGDGRILSWGGGSWGNNDESLRLWQADGTSLGVLEGHTGGVNGALMMADGRFLSWSRDATLRL